ncbi:hypothetical protein ACOME3_000943 [Neoechinorhynchus agilis]
MDSGTSTPKTGRQLKKLEKLAKYKTKQNVQVFAKSPNLALEKCEPKTRLEVSFDIDGKKDTSQFPDSYDPEYVESGWYSWWYKQGLFSPDLTDDTNDRFVMIMPPPNVTGTLHLGHALTCTLEDAIARYYRMKGRNVLWLPGCDHAGIATQVVVEKWLSKTIGKSRHDLGRDAFVQKILDWKEEKGGKIYEQIKLMGSSCDWSRSVFTMDSTRSYAVREAFIRLFEKGEIYRDRRIVNWSVVLRSVISDIEVEKVQIDGRTQISVPGYDRKITFGTMIKFAYELKETDGEIIVATTRLETMLGDVAIAVHPKDPRYLHTHGKHARHPFFKDRELVVVADESVEIDFGTGAVKISPGHDQMDFDIAKKFNLPIFGCLDEDGRISEGFGKFSGMKRFDARRAIEQDLAQMGFIRGEKEEIGMVLPVCSRSKDIIEPMVKPQWFLKMADSSAEANRLIQEGNVIKVLPEKYKADCNRQLSNPRDWCLSRQLWWGHRIPAYKVAIDQDEEQWFCGHDEHDVRRKYHLSGDVQLQQDEDVLDTWFSSSLLPFSALGWPSNTTDFKKFFPSSLLETGHDILFFWVMRMLIMSMKLLDGQIPFKKVFLHGLIRDSHGRKMSKSLGNIIDPIDVIKGTSLEILGQHLRLYNLDDKELKRALREQKNDFPNGIPQCGTDALRFSFAAYSSQSTDINLDVLRVQGYRFFCNKMWNAFKFSMPFFSSTMLRPLTNGNWHPFDSWILSRLSACVFDSNCGFEHYDFARTSTSIYNFFLYDLCDLYIEYSKPVLYEKKDTKRYDLLSNILTLCFDTVLKLAHPLMPYLTEELYQRIPGVSSSISVTSYPRIEDFEMYNCPQSEKLVQSFKECLQKIRSFRSVCEIPPKFRVLDLCLLKLFCEILLSLSMQSEKKYFKKFSLISFR